MQDYLNDFYDILSEKVLNVPKDKHRLEIKKEYKSRRYFSTAKKRYTQWIISDNGVPVDKLDVKGLDVKRSSFLMATSRNHGQESLISILRGKRKKKYQIKFLPFKKVW